MTEVEIDPAYRKPWLISAFQTMSREYEAIGLITEELFKENLRIVFDRLPKAARFFVLSGNEWVRPRNAGRWLFQPTADVNRWSKEVVEDYQNGVFIDVHPYLVEHDAVDPEQASHFRRSVYYRIYEDIVTRIGADKGAARDMAVGNGE